MLERTFAARITLLAANGSHLPVSDDRLTDLVGGTMRRRYPVWQHDCRDRDSLLFFGETSSGTPVWLNRRLRECDWVITLGPVVLHYFAGFGGGPKMIFPGLAGYDTIDGNHRRAIDFSTGRLDPRAGEGHIEDNPVYRDLAEVGRWIPNWLSWQMVLDERGGIRYSAVGPPVEVHRELAAKALSLFCVPIGDRGDVVVASAGGHPSDVNLIQAHKSIHHAFQAVRENGWLIVLAECSEGIGSETFLSYFDCGTSEAIAERLRGDYRLNGQTALALRIKTEKARIVLVSGLDPALVRRTGMIPAADFEEAWSRVGAGLAAGKRARGYVFPNAAQYLPVVSSS
jgi:nickel-dependent lactate racemase